MAGMSSTSPGLSAARANLQLQYPMSLGTYERYEDAQRAVDYLADHEFPVENVLIVGTDLKQLERVTGRITRGRIALGGLMSGAWLGAFVAMVFMLFDSANSTPAMMLSTILFGAVFGLVWALIGYAMTRGRRDFASVTQVVATRYEVLVEHRFVQQGRDLLTEMDPMAAAQAQVARARAEAEAAQAQAQPQGQSQPQAQPQSRPEEPAGPQA